MSSAYLQSAFPLVTACKSDASTTYDAAPICRKSPILTHPTCIWSPPQRVIPVEFREDLWLQKSRVPLLSFVFLCVILCLAVSYRIVNLSLCVATASAMSLHNILAENRPVLCVMIIPVLCESTAPHVDTCRTRSPVRVDRSQ